MATSQVARYLYCPRRSHELALEHIGRYLGGTIDKGIILHPTKFDKSFKIDVDVDATFAYGWSIELGTNPDSIISRTGFIIKVMGCPILWVARLQKSIATSTMESDIYCSLHVFT